MQTLNDIYIRDFIGKVLASDVAPRGLLLDLGCGRRPYASLYQTPTRQSVCVDTHLDSAADIVADARCLPFGRDAFDCIICSEVIEHIYNYDESIGEMARVLKSGGILVITWPFMYGIHHIPHDYNRFSEFAMREYLKRHGLVITHLIRRCDVFGVLHTLLGQYVYGAIDAFTKVPWIGAILKPLAHMVQKLVQATYRLHYILVHRSRRLNPAAPGDGLSGTPGSLALWTLGYCAIARKDGSACNT